MGRNVRLSGAVRVVASASELARTDSF